MKSLQNCQLVAALLLSSKFLLASCQQQWVGRFEPDRIKVETNLDEHVRVSLSNLPDYARIGINDRNIVRFRVDNLQDWEVAGVNQNEVVFTEIGETEMFEAEIVVKGIFIGRASISVEVRPAANASHDASPLNLEVIVLRPDRLIDTMFTVTIVFLLTTSLVNFGAALDVEVMKQLFKKPVGPGIGTFCQVVFLPLIAYGLGWALFGDNPELAFGLFLTGIAPAGGASNIWSLLLGGNINLSILMTTISTLLCFGTMPFWLFVLGQAILKRTNQSVPYAQVAVIASALLIPLAVGLLIPKCLPRVGKVLVSLLKPLALVFIIVVLILGLMTNWYMLQFFAWQIIVTSLSFPLFGYVFGWIAASVFRQPTENVIAISIETEINQQLTAADIAIIVPIGITVGRPLPLIIFVLAKKFIERRKAKKALKNAKPEPSAILPTIEHEQQTEQPLRITRIDSFTEKSSNEIQLH